MSSLRDSKHLEIPLKVIEAATNNFKTIIGKGGYGSVYKGELSIHGRSTIVAVKRLNDQHGQGLKEFLTEIQLLSGQQHQNLISLIGYCEEGKEKIIVYEYAARGSLDTYLRRNRTSNDDRLTWKRRLEICINAAQGLNYLHNHARKDQIIIHRDIKSSNILIDGKWVAKISDLGLSKLSLTRLEGNTLITNACGTWGYCDPEYTKTGILTKESDIYSFGIVLFEVLCGRLCLVKDKDNGFLLSAASIKEYYEMRNLEAIIDPSLSEQIGSASMSRFAEIAYRCLLDDRRQRPSIDVVVKALEESLRIHQSSNKDDGKDVESPSSQSYDMEHTTQIRRQKAWRMFQHFDLNQDGGLNKEELGNLVIAMNPDETPNNIDMLAFYDMLSSWHNRFFDETRGISFHGLISIYDEDGQDVDKDFRMLGFDLISNDNNKATSSTQERHEKVQRIFQHFDLNQDGGLNKEELSNLVIATDTNETNDIYVPILYDSLSLWQNKFLDKEKGISFDGFLLIYEECDVDVDEDFRMTGIELTSHDNNEATSSTQERCEKVRRIFQHFDVNRDGCLNKEELSNLIVSTNPDTTYSDAELQMKYISICFWYNKFIDKKNGLSYDGLLLRYNKGHGDVDEDFRMLGLKLTSYDNDEATSSTRERKMEDTDSEDEDKMVFRKIDKDQNGFISFAELRNIYKDNGMKRTDKEIDAIIHALDLDGDRQISFEEFKIAVNEKMEDTDSKDEAKDLFRKIDKDQNGFISFAELRDLLKDIGQKHTDKQIDAIIRAWDLDGDRQISYEEFKIAMNKSNEDGKPQLSMKTAFKKGARFLKWAWEKLDDL